MRNYTDMKLDEVSFSYHAHWIELAEDGNVGAAKILMGDASILLQRGKPLPEPLGSYIGEALFNTANTGAQWGDDDAFHLKRGRGKNKHTEDIRKHLICMEVQLSYLFVGRYESRFMEGAYDIVAEDHDFGEVGHVKKTLTSEHIKTIFTGNHARWNVKGMTKAELQTLILKCRPLLQGKHI